MHVSGISVGDGAPLILICGLNVIESEQGTLEIAGKLKEIVSRHAMPFIFKASYDKANRSRYDSFRGPGLDEGLRILSLVKRETGLPLTTDIHEPGHAKIAAEVVDLLQIPAFLCRQTDLLAACAGTGLPINLKKGQFIAPENIQQAVDKLQHFGCEDILVTDRGSQFGYNNLVTDFRGLVQMRRFTPVCFDATHAAQYPGSMEGSTGGDRRFVGPLARAAVAVGIDAVFIEVHPNPEEAPCDGPSQINIEQFQRILTDICAIRDALVQAHSEER